MTARRFITPRFVALLAAAIVVLQFAAVEHAAAHGGAAPDVGCEFCLSGAGNAPPLGQAPVAPVHTAGGHAAPAATVVASPKPRRTAQPARAPPTLG